MHTTNDTKEYIAGWNAFYFGGCGPDGCPYEEHSTAATDWQLGRIDAQAQFSWMTAQGG